jgi:hypothetical protein
MRYVCRASCPLRFLLLFCLLCPTIPLPAQGLAPGNALYVADSSTDRVVRLEDLDASGVIDPAVVGEVVAFYDDSSPGPDLSTPGALVFDPDRGLFLVDGGTLDTVLLLIDGNNDNDANDADEYSVFFDNTAGAPPLGTPNALVLTGDGSFYLADDGKSRALILRLDDANSDGDAMDEGEWFAVYDSDALEAENGAPPALLDPEAMVVGEDGRIFVTDATAKQVFVLEDVNNDGDVMDDGEVQVYFDPGDSYKFNDPEGMSLTTHGDIFVTDEDTGLILKLRDLDGDGTAMGTNEVHAFLDETAILAPRDTNDILALGNGALLILDGSRDQVFLAFDEDGDGAALSEGEVTGLLTSPDVLATPSGIAASVADAPPVATFKRGDVNDDSQADMTDALGILVFLLLDDSIVFCKDAGDVDDDGTLTITDPIRLLEHLFLGSEPPASPYPDPGPDPTADELDC